MMGLLRVPAGRLFTYLYFADKPEWLGSCSMRMMGASRACSDLGAND